MSADLRYCLLRFCWHGVMFFKGTILTLPGTLLVLQVKTLLKDLVMLCVWFRLKLDFGRLNKR